MPRLLQHSLPWYNDYNDYNDYTDYTDYNAHPYEKLLSHELGQSGKLCLTVDSEYL